MFLQPIVQEANQVNQMFQMENTNPCRLFHELITFYLSLLRRVTKISTVVVDSSRWTEIIAFDEAIETNQCFFLELMGSKGSCDIVPLGFLRTFDMLQMAY